jgi:DNA-binding response OmpR family regulator
MPGLKIAVVDDDDLIREIICTTIQETYPKAEIAAYVSAKQAFHEIETSTVDLLVTNCHMPDMDGPTLVRTLREQKHSLPIIMVSGSDDARRLGEEAGIDRFVAKHLIQHDLQESLYALLEVPGRQAAG